MKRLILLIVVAMLVYWVWARERSRLIEPARASGHRNGHRFVQDREARKQQLAKAGHEVKRALRDAEHEIRHAIGKTHDELHRALDEVRQSIRNNDSDDDETGARAKASVLEREDAEGLPVPIVPGTRVIEARPVPPMPRVANKTRPGSQTQAEAIAVNTKAEEASKLDCQISASPERAAAQARVDLRQHISAWLDPDVPRSWTIPERLMDSIILDTELETVPRTDELGPMYVTHLKLDESPPSRARFIEVYNHELVGRRLVNLGGSLAFILICLGAVSGYIRADEATKGYYTNRLRMLAAAGVGAGGVLIYQMVT
jgi:hypothetical protein